jgi:DNA primase catalytic core
MPRIPQPDLDRIKQGVPLVDLAAERGVVLSGQGTNLVGRCPFHDDRTPSLVIDPVQNLWNCLGACQQGGDAIRWVEVAEGVGFVEAVARLRAWLDGVPAAPAAALAGPRLRAAPAAPTADATDLLRRVVLEHYPSRLVSGSPGAVYLERRGLTDRALWARFHLGVADRTLDAGLGLSGSSRAAQTQARAALQAVGLVRATGHEHLRGCVTIPITDAAGAVVGCYGRRIEAQDHIRHLYLPGPHRGVWNEAGVAAATRPTGSWEPGTVILCEALIDALSVIQAGFEHTTAAYGVGGFTADHHAALRRHGIRRVLIAYDRDEAGDTAATALAARLAHDGIACWRVRFPPGQDANAVALRQGGDAAAAFAALFASAVWMGSGAEPRRRGALPAAGTAMAAAVTTATVAAVSILAATPAITATADMAVMADIAATAEAPATAAAMAPTDADPVPSASPGDDLTVVQDARTYRLRLPRSGSGSSSAAGPAVHDHLRVVLRLSIGPTATAAPLIDTVDLVSRRSREGFVAAAVADLGQAAEVIRRDLGAVLVAVEEALARRRQHASAPPPDPVATMDPAARQAALELLHDPDLIARTLTDLDRCGLIGEEQNKLMALIALASRHLDQPLAVLIQSLSGAGKTTLMDGVLAFMPPEQRLKYSAISKQSLYYLGDDTDLRHKVLALVEEEGASAAAYALKLLQSEGELTIASTGKDPQSGRMVTHAYRVEGPVMLLLTTTAVDLDEELQNRCVVLTVDEDRAQTRAVHALQRTRRTLDGRLAHTTRSHLTTLHQNAQRLLRPVAVVNPFAPLLTFPDHRTRLRRDHAKYLALIDAIALWHQYQRPRRTATTADGQALAYIEATWTDVVLATRLAHQVLGRSLDDLAPQTRRVLGALTALADARAAATGVARALVRITRRDLREAIGLSNTQVRLHLDRLEALELVIAHGSGRGQLTRYEVAYTGPAEVGPGPHLPGLIAVAPGNAAAPGEAPASDPATGAYPPGLAGILERLTGGWRPQDGPVAGGERGVESAQNVDEHQANDAPTTAEATDAHHGSEP